MIKKLQFIADRLEPGRTDVWECEMLYKLVHKDLIDQQTESYLHERFTNPYSALSSLLSQLYQEAQNS